LKIIKFLYLSRSPVVRKREKKYDSITIRSRSSSPVIKVEARSATTKEIIDQQQRNDDVQIIEPDMSAYSRLFQKSKVKILSFFSIQETRLRGWSLKGGKIGSKIICTKI
jgi:hypothetical protein